MTDSPTPVFWSYLTSIQGYVNQIQTTHSILQLTAKEIQTIFKDESQLWAESSLVLSDVDQPYLVMFVSYKGGAAIVRNRLM